MKRRLCGADRFLPLALTILGLTVVLVLASLALTACGTDSNARTTTLDTGVTTVTTDSGVSATATVWDTGYTTTSTTPASVPALSSGITPEQVLQLVASKSQVPVKDWELRESKTLGDWAVANLYTSRFSEQMDARGVGAVFEKRDAAWFFKGWVSVSDPSNQPVELTNMGAPTEVWAYFGLEPLSQSTDQSGLTKPLPALSLGDVAYVELSHSTPVEADPGDRRVLSPVGDSADVQALVDAYARAAIVPDAGFSRNHVDLAVIIHLRDGSALNILWQKQDSRPGLIEFYDGKPASAAAGQGLDGPTWSHTASAPALLGAAEQEIARPGSEDETASLPTTMPKDFGMVAAFGVYGKMVLDTFAGTFHKDMVLPQNTTATVDLRLTQAELQLAYSQLVGMDILAYPSDFIPKPDTGVTPNQAYYLRIKAGGIEKEIRWNDSTLSLDPRAKALRGWFKGLADLIYATPEYRALPGFRGGYA